MAKKGTAAKRLSVVIVVSAIGVTPAALPAFAASNRETPTGIIVFHSDKQGKGDVFVMRADGKNVKRVTNSKLTGAESSSPSVSPDGSKISFQTEYGQQGPQVVTIERAGKSFPIGKEEASRTQDGNSAQPAYSPDGRYLAFQSTAEEADKRLS